MKSFLKTLVTEVKQMTKHFERLINDKVTTRLAHWKRIQLRLKLPEYIGMGGSQNLSVFILGKILNAPPPCHRKNQILEEHGQLHYLHRQRALAQYFKERVGSIVSRNIVQGGEETDLWNAAVKQMHLWRMIHKQRTLRYISSVNADNYETSMGHKTTTSDLDAQLTSRMEKYQTLQKKQ